MIQMYHVTKHYPPAQRALEDVSFSVEKGEFIFLNGPSGAGKSTLLKLLFLAGQPTHGQIVIDGVNVSRLRDSQIPRLRRRMGFIFQDFKLIENWSVFENVALALEVLVLPRKEIRRKVMKALRLVDLGHRQDARPIALSGGEQQRIAIARAIANDPEILLADEPTGNLDMDIAFGTMKLLQDVNARGTTIIVATHDMELVGRFYKRRIVLEQGRVVKDDD